MPPLLLDNAGEVAVILLGEADGVTPLLLDEAREVAVLLLDEVEVVVCKVVPVAVVLGPFPDVVV